MLMSGSCARRLSKAASSLLSEGRAGLITISRSVDNVSPVDSCTRCGASHSGCQSAVDGKYCAIYIAGIVGTQEEHYGRNFLRHADTLHRNVGQNEIIQRLFAGLAIARADFGVKALAKR